MELQQEQLVQASTELLDRVYTACQGLSPLTCPTAAMFVTTYHEVRAQWFTCCCAHAQENLYEAPKETIQAPS